MRASTTSAASLLLAVLLHLGGPARADEWDSAMSDDDSPNTRNALHHGSEQVHDLAAFGGVADEDWYLLTTRGYSSYQMVIDGQTGDLGLVATDFQKLNPSSVVEQSAESQDFGGVLSLSWREGPGDPQPRTIRVRSAACALSPCGSEDRYRIRFYETTYTIPRFNNSGTQTTVLIVQNLTDRECEVLYHLDSATGDFDTGGDFFPYGMHVIDTAAVAPNQSGHVRIAHTCGYGGLAGKAVAIEPATGFTFDTAMVHLAN
ncbi:MAG: hypothetical protein ABW221_15585 [Vicinamibacteria bacterium]